MGGEGQNGDRLNRQVKATEAYANLTRDIKDLRDDLFGDAAAPGILPEIRDSLKGLEANPMVRLGVALGTTRRAVLALGAFAAWCVGIGAGLAAAYDRLNK